jgi:hypothetical protein
MPTATLNSRALADLRAEGWLAQVVEQWNSFSHTRKDLFGVGDILAIRGAETLLIQLTSGSAHANRRSKILNNPAVAKWLAGPRQLQIWSYRKNSKNRWVRRVEEFYHTESGVESTELSASMLP